MLSDILLIIDTREQNQKRIKAVELWAMSHDATIEHGKLDECDYSLEGTFHGCEINLAIEAKSMPDFCGSWKELKERFTRAREIYSEVALFVESANYTFSEDPETKKTIINNPRVQDGTADVCPLAVYEGLLDTLSFSGVHVRQLRSEYHFPYAIQNLLTYITNEHELIPAGKSYVSNYRRVLMSFEGIGWKGADKLMKAYPNLHWLCSADPSAYEIVLGKSGRRLGEFIRNHELETLEWKYSNHKDGSPRACERCKDQGMYEEASIVKVCGYCQAGIELEAWWKACPAWFGKPLSFFRQRKDSKEGLKPFENIPTSKLSGKEQQNNVIGSSTLPANKTRCAESKDGASSQSLDAGNSMNTVASNPGIHDTSGKESTSVFLDSALPGSQSSDDDQQESFLKPPLLNPAVAGVSPPSTPANNSHTGLILESPPIPKPGDSSVQSALTGDISLRDIKPDDWHLSRTATPQAKKVAGLITEIKNHNEYKMTLKEQIKEFFSDGKGHSIQEVVDAYAGFDKGRVFDYVMSAHKAGYFRSYTQKGVRMFARAVIPDKEMDVGV